MLHQQIKVMITRKEIIFSLIVYSSEDEFLCTSPSLAAVEKTRTDWCLGCSYHPRQPPGHLVPEARIVVGVTVRSLLCGLHTHLKRKPKPLAYITSATFDEEHLNHPTSFLQPLGTLRSSSPQLVRFCEITHLQK